MNQSIAQICNYAVLLCDMGEPDRIEGKYAEIMEQYAATGLNIGRSLMKK